MQDAGNRFRRWAGNDLPNGLGGRPVGLLHRVSIAALGVRSAPLGVRIDAAVVDHRHLPARRLRRKRELITAGHAIPVLEFAFAWLAEIYEPNAFDRNDLRL